MSYYNIGDKVRIKDDTYSRYRGYEGVVTNAYSDGESLLVRIQDGPERGYFAREVELIEPSTFRQSQIAKIAQIVRESSADHDDPFTEATSGEFAERLFARGVRFGG